ncbi:MAG TPA: hypothetical protein VJM12_02070 [Pyrinomonadaceae bacterium]|nr:hypothetical protein [Pyrinomonadaceae bacterium]
MERRSIRTLLSQGAAGGACATFLCTLFLIAVAYPDEGLVWILVFPVSLAFGMVAGAAAGFAIWISQKVINRNLRVPSRILISTLFTLGLCVLFILSLGTIGAAAENSFGLRFVFHILFGTPIGMLAGSTVRPWRLIARGINGGSTTRVLFRRGPIRISQPIRELGFTGLPLRAASLFALMVSWLLVTCVLNSVWRGSASLNNLEVLTEFLLATAYFGLTVAVSFTERRKWGVLIIAVLLNVPWAIWMLKTDQPEPNAFALLLVSIFIISWLLFVTGMIVFPEKGSVQVELGHTEIRFGKQQWVRESQ